MVRDLRPTWARGSPPCTAFSIWNFGMNYKKMDAKAVAAALEEGRLHLRFMSTIYREQLRHGRHFLREHPASALGWREECIDFLRFFPGAGEVVCDQCQFGLTTKGDAPGERSDVGSAGSPMRQIAQTPPPHRRPMCRSSVLSNPSHSSHLARHQGHAAGRATGQRKSSPCILNGC